MQVFSGPLGRLSSIGSLAPTTTLHELETFLSEQITGVAPNDCGGSLFHSDNTNASLEKAVRQVHFLNQKYSSVVTNPPYMGSAYHHTELKQFLKDFYSGYDKDLFACFIKRCADFLHPSGRIGLMTPMVWMFTSSHKKIREQLVTQNTLSSLIQLEYNASGEVRVPLCTFTAIRANLGNFNGSYIRLTEFYGEDLQAPKALEAIHDKSCDWMHNCLQEDLRVIPSMPIAYWVSRAMRNCFMGKPLSAAAEIQEGLKTGDNGRFIRKWYEVSVFDIYPGLNAVAADYTWVPHTKGAGYRKWYGNNDDVLFYKNNGQALRGFKKASLTGSQNYFKENITWGRLTSANASFRYTHPGSIPNMAGLALYSDRESLIAICALLNSKPYQEFLALINPTLNFPPGTISSLPLPNARWKDLGTMASEAIEIAEEDWATLETSRTFKSNPLFNLGSNLSGGIAHFRLLWAAKTERLKIIEETINKSAISCLGIDGELSADASIRDISLSRNPLFKGNKQEKGVSPDEIFEEETIKETLSYGAGCMMGRYSLDKPGLVLADVRNSQAEQLAAYEEKVGKPLSEVQFKPDPDGIIPVLDGEWFEDDIVARTREFLAVTFPESSVGENLRFIEESLGKDVRKYFCSDFYKDHLQTYKKRPIYWLVQSPKKGFSCLIYLHRYTKDTLNQVLNNYFRTYLRKLEARLVKLGLDQLNDDLSTRERTAARKEAEKITKVLKECQAWEQDALLPLAQQRIELDLDDGVKVNYLKLQDVLAPIPGLAAKEE